MAKVLSFRVSCLSWLGFSSRVKGHGFPCLSSTLQQPMSTKRSRCLFRRCLNHTDVPTRGCSTTPPRLGIRVGESGSFPNIQSQSLSISCSVGPGDAVCSVGCTVVLPQTTCETDLLLRVFPEIPHQNVTQARMERSFGATTLVSSEEEYQETGFRICAGRKA